MSDLSHVKNNKNDGDVLSARCTQSGDWRAWTDCTTVGEHWSQLHSRGGLGLSGTLRLELQPIPRTEGLSVYAVHQAQVENTHSQWFRSERLFWPSV